MKPKWTPPSGMSAFMVISVGQFISLLGSGMVGFGLSIWAWQETGQATALALAGFFYMGPTILLSPMAGALVDRSNRKLVMMVSDLAAGLTTIVLLVLYSLGELEVWHIYLTNAFSGAFQAFQFPAYSAAMSTILDKAQYGRANGIRSLAEAASNILAPAAAAVALGFIGIGGLMVIDVITFVAAITSLLVVHIPQPRASAAGRDGRGSLWHESGYGFRYIFSRPSLLGLQLVFFALNLYSGVAMTVHAPMILARTGNDELALGSVRSVGGLGMLIGSLLLSTWGGPRRKVYGVLGGMIVGALFGTMLMGVGRGVPVWMVAAFIMMSTIPIINGSNQAIWQAKVPPDIQGRVFAVRRLIAQVTAPVAMLATGPLADHLFEPALQAHGAWADQYRWVVGTGPGAGMALMIVFTGLLSFLSALGALAVRRVREVERLLPDHDAALREA